jgi:hypothetical protein
MASWLNRARHPHALLQLPDNNLRLHLDGPAPQRARSRREILENSTTKGEMDGHYRPIPRIHFFKGYL